MSQPSVEVIKEKTQKSVFVRPLEPLILELQKYSYFWYLFNNRMFYRFRTISNYKKVVLKTSRHLLL